MSRSLTQPGTIPREERRVVPKIDTATDDIPRVEGLPEVLAHAVGCQTLTIITMIAP
jgi:hypothetical protein